MHERKNFLFYDPSPADESSSTISWKENLQVGLVLALILHFSWVVINYFLP